MALRPASRRVAFIAAALEGLYACVTLTMTINNKIVKARNINSGLTTLLSWRMLAVVSEDQRQALRV